MAMELATPKCRLELEDGTLLWEANELPKFWRPQRDDVVVSEGIEYEVKNIAVSFIIHPGVVDPGSGEATADHLGLVQTISVALKA